MENRAERQLPWEGKVGLGNRAERQLPWEGKVEKQSRQPPQSLLEEVPFDVHIRVS